MSASNRFSLKLSIFNFLPKIRPEILAKEMISVTRESVVSFLLTRKVNMSFFLFRNAAYSLIYSTTRTSTTAVAFMVACYRIFNF